MPAAAIPATPTDRFAGIIDGLCRAVAARGGGRDRLDGPLVIRKRPASAVMGRSGWFCLFENPLYGRGQCVEPALQRVRVLTAEPGVVALLGTEDVIVRAGPEVEAPGSVRVNASGEVRFVGFDADDVAGAGGPLA
jgi:hypothetical protein